MGSRCYFSMCQFLWLDLMSVYCFFQSIDITDQTAVDQVMLDLDGTENKCKGNG